MRGHRQNSLLWWWEKWIGQCLASSYGVVWCVYVCACVRARAKNWICQILQLCSRFLYFSCICWPVNYRKLWHFTRFNEASLHTYCIKQTLCFTVLVILPLLHFVGAFPKLSPSVHLFTYNFGWVLAFVLWSEGQLFIHETHWVHILFRGRNDMYMFKVAVLCGYSLMIGILHSASNVNAVCVITTVQSLGSAPHVQNS